MAGWVDGNVDGIIDGNIDGIVCGYGRGWFVLVKDN